MRVALLFLVVTGCSAGGVASVEPVSRESGVRIGLDAYEFQVLGHVQHKWNNLYAPVELTGICDPTLVRRKVEYGREHGWDWRIGQFYSDGAGELGIIVRDDYLNTFHEENILAHEFVHYLSFCATGSVDAEHAGPAWSIVSDWRNTKGLLHVD